MRPLLATLPILALTACATAQPAPASPPTGEVPDTLTLIERRLAEIDTLRGKITHVTIQGLLGDEQRRFGTIVYDDADDPHPARFALRFDRVAEGDQLQPADVAFIFDGRWLADVNGEAKTFIRRELVAEGDTSGGDITELGEGPFPIPLNLKRDKVLQRFDVEEISEPSEDLKVDAIHLRLTPKRGVEMDQTQIDLWFAKDSLLPLKAETLESDETKQTIYLRDLEVNPKLDESTFRTAAPSEAGWQVEDQPLAE